MMDVIQRIGMEDTMGATGIMRKLDFRTKSPVEVTKIMQGEEGSNTIGIGESRRNVNRIHQT